MGKVSEFTRVVEKLAQEAERLEDQAAKANPVPLMQERLSKRDARTRMGRMTPQDLQGMTPEARKELVQQLGTDAVVGIIRRARRG